MSMYSEKDWERLKNFGYLEDFTYEAYFRGGEKHVEELVGADYVLPFSVEEILEAGVSSLSKKFIKLKTPKEVQDEIKQAMNENKGYSLIRVGDGELLTLAHDLLVSTEDIKSIPRLNFLSYAGVNLPDHSMRDLLANNMLEADMVGIPFLRRPTFQQLFNKLAKHHNWPLEHMNLTRSVINYELHLQTTLFQDLLSNQRILLIGNRMMEGETVLRNAGFNNIAGSIPVENIYSVPQVLSEAQKYDFDVAFVSAGIPANLICVELAKCNKIAIDFGHLIDELINNTKVIAK
ncbi:GT-D fold domain-containing glycosyltransferase [Cytobacillus firmus]|uniref:GT-D fold domain-containing protein n=1 Tax=Cytobacillus firmus TaxID=1399 RepID=UPI00222834B1|nr:GT-D fold domain-containing glycosyltransferase [Cytobacillus firmus]